MISTLERRLTATQFHGFMGSGRTSPILCGCEDEAGNYAGEFVVKLRGGLDQGVTGLVCELVASRLATYFGLSVAEPPLVLIDAEFAGLVAALESSAREPLKGQKVLDSVGLNFASRHIADMIVWPVDKSVPDAMWQTATEIFAFDALIQNPDRRFNNPNLFTRGDSVVVFDHELAFSFLLDILPSATPWRLANHRYLKEHVFYNRLKSRPVDLSRFTSLLAELPQTLPGSLLAEVPWEWNNESLVKIEIHLKAISAHAAEFAEEVRRSLA